MTDWNCRLMLPVMLLLLSSLLLADEPANKPDKNAAHRGPANALIHESSPYLLMHAHNPVQWQPWNESSLAMAKEQQKPIFLSVGYSSCHWCHVMERESFLDAEIAAFLNEHFICIKVDREERPDVDEIYMESLHVLNRMMGNGRGGGWPLSMFLTPDTKPFYGGTYFPARNGDRGGHPGFLDVIQKMETAWQQQRPAILNSAQTITDVTRKQLTARPGKTPTAIQSRWSKVALSELSASFDAQYGGFGFDPNNSMRPKFPEPSNLFFLHYLATDKSDESAKQMLLDTLRRMQMGGIYDHLGGGFHRYSVDRYWKIPHFEKMLYDNGQLVTLYAEAWQMTDALEFRAAAVESLDFVLRELTSGDGGFFSSLDAESEGEEGKFYEWQPAEIRDAVGNEAYPLFAKIYGIDQPPNFEGKAWVPQWSTPIATMANARGVATAELFTQLQPSRETLREMRERRPRPLRDEKILTEWNGLMIRGFADAGRIFEKQSYVDAAANAANFALKNLRANDGSIYRTYTAGEAKLTGYLTDYACLIDGMIALHRATDDRQWLDHALEIQEQQNSRFLDTEQGGYFYTALGASDLLIRTKRTIDGAVPSGNSVSAGNLLYLAEQLDRNDLRDLAVQTVLSSGNMIDSLPLAAPRLLIAAERLRESAGK